MKPTRQIIAAIKKACPKGTDDADFIADELDAIERTKQDIAAVERKKKLAKERYQKELADIRKEEAEIEKKCKHWVVDYHPDPSGNNDSSDTCNICGKDFSTPPYRHS
jgi:hypothetical protein